MSMGAVYIPCSDNGAGRSPYRIPASRPLRQERAFSCLCTCIVQKLGPWCFATCTIRHTVHYNIVLGMVAQSLEWFTCSRRDLDSDPTKTPAWSVYALPALCVWRRWLWCAGHLRTPDYVRAESSVQWHRDEPSTTLPVQVSVFCWHPCGFHLHPRSLHCGGGSGIFSRPWKN